MAPRRRGQGTGDFGDDNNCCAVIGKDLIFAGEVGPKLAIFLWENLLRAGSRLDEDTSKTKEGRRLFLNSTGGETETMFSIVDLMEEVDNISTVATGSCMSAAVPIIAAGTPGQRHATHRTRFLIHPAWWSTDDRLEKETMAAETEEFEVIHDAYAAIMTRYCKHSKSWWKAKLDTHRPWYFGAAEAREHGIIDNILADRLRKQ
jgi:ATP-dependent protease ClpP protease subunit